MAQIAVAEHKSEADMLEKIRQAELDSDSRIAAARKEAEKIIADAKDQSARIVQEAESSARTQRESVIAQGKAATEEEVKKIGEQADQNVASFKQKASAVSDLKNLVLSILQE
jgi:V/A-type H+/Na+-transporting ATPase subunit G/H